MHLDSGRDETTDAIFTIKQIRQKHSTQCKVSLERKVKRK